MGIQHLMTMLLVACAVAGCGTIGAPSGASPTMIATTAAPGMPLATPTLAIQREMTMQPDLQSGPIPDNIDPRLNNRDTKPLPAGALIKFQRINRGKNPSYNYRWVLYPDGRWFLATNSGADIARDTPFDTELPTQPTKTLPADLVQQIQSALVDANFATLPPYTINPTVEDGSFNIVTARLNGNVHEVIYEAYQPPFVELLADVVTKYR